MKAKLPDYTNLNRTALRSGFFLSDAELIAADFIFVIKTNPSLMVQVVSNILSLLYPDVCPACGQLLLEDEKTVCLSCHILMPRTGYEQFADNPVARMFWGKIPLNAVSARFFFTKKGRIQHLVHELKYKGNRDAGLYLGKEIAVGIQSSAFYQGIDYLIPVPLHPKRIKIRGYNQSEVLAQGMQSILAVPLSTNHLIRSVATETQTKKSREARWKNVKDIFVLNEPGSLSGKHVLLIDDVITTGSTIEACAAVLATAPEIKISVAAAACPTN